MTTRRRRDGQRSPHRTTTVVPKPSQFALDRMNIEIDETKREMICELHSPQVFAEFRDSQYQKNEEKHEEKDDWSFGGLTMDEAQRALAWGIPPEETVVKFNEYRDALSSTVQDFSSTAKSTKRKRVYREDGAELDIDRMMTFDPACWVSRVRGAKRKLVRLAIQFGFSCGASPEVFARSAAMGCAAADLLTKLGYAVEIHGISDMEMCDPTKFKRWKSVMTVPFKRSEDALDVQQVMTLGMRSTFRVFGFAAYGESLGLSGGGMFYETRWNAYPKTDRFDAMPFDAIIGQSFTVSKNGSLEFDDALKGFEKTMNGLGGSR